MNTGAELVVQAPSKARAGKAFKVTVWAYDATGQRKPADRAKVKGDTVKTTDANGQVTFKIAKPRTLELRATRGSDIASARAPVKVAKK
jgi:hypothetical protein